MLNGWHAGGVCGAGGAVRHQAVQQEADPEGRLLFALGGSGWRGRWGDQRPPARLSAQVGPPAQTGRRGTNQPGEDDRKLRYSDKGDNKKLNEFPN